MADWFDGPINPATGLPTRNGVDTSGNLYGLGPVALETTSTGRRRKGSDVPFRDLPLSQRIFLILFVAIVLGTIAWNLAEKAIF